MSVKTRSNETQQPVAAMHRSGADARGRLARLSTTRANAHAGLVSDSVVSFALLAAGLWRYAPGPRTALLVIIAGLLIFSFIEYGFHRWLFHGRIGPAEAGHRKHHADPSAHDALPFFLPPLGMLAFAAALHGFLPHGIALLLAGAVAAGYAAYGLAHTAIHNRRFRGSLLARWAALHHIHHHHPERNFGVTTPLWDIVLGTRYVPARVAAARQVRE